MCIYIVIVVCVYSGPQHICYRWGVYVHGDSDVCLGGPAVQAVVVIVVVVVIVLGSRVGALVCSCWQGLVGTYAWYVFVLCDCTLWWYRYG